MATETEATFTRHLDDGTPYVSPSQVKQINGCGARYEWKYVLGNTHPGGENLHVGLLTHELIEAYATDADTADDPLGHASQYVYEEVPRDELDSLSAAALVHEALRLLDAFKDHAEREEWTFLEAESEVIDRRDSPALRGFLDLLVDTGEGVEVVDVKTTGRSPSYGEARERDAYQIVMYADAKRHDGIPVNGARALYLVRNKTVKVVDAPVDIGPEATQWAHAVHTGGVKKIQRGDFEPNPFGAGFLCAPDKCGRWSTCPGAARWREDDDGDEGGAS